MSAAAKKQEYAKRLYTYLDRYTKALLVTCDNVGSKQFQVGGWMASKGPHRWPRRRWAGAGCARASCACDGLVAPFFEPPIGRKYHCLPDCGVFARAACRASLLSPAFWRPSSHPARSPPSQEIRRAVRGQSVILMGKNTMIKRCLNLYMERTGNRFWAPLEDLLVGNVGIIFTEADLSDVRAEISKFKVGAPARVGAVSNCDVKIPAGSTGMDPSATNFFQALNIATKINK